MCVRGRHGAKAQDPQHLAHRVPSLRGEAAERVHQVRIRGTRMGRCQPRPLFDDPRSLQHLVAVERKADTDIGGLLRREPLPLETGRRSTYWRTYSDGGTTHRRARHLCRRRIQRHSGSSAEGRGTHVTTRVFRVRHSYGTEPGQHLHQSAPTLLGRVQPPRRYRPIRSEARPRGRTVRQRRQDRWWRQRRHHQRRCIRRAA